MNDKNERRWARFVLCVALLAAPLAHADEVTITGRYVGGEDREFENTTPPTGWCAGQPEYCDNQATVGVPISYTKLSVTGAGDVRDRFYLRMPRSKRVTVTNRRGESHTLDLDMLTVSQTVSSVSDVAPPPTSMNVRGGCRFLDGGWDDDSGVPGARRSGYFAWWINTPANPGDCYVDADGAKPGDRFEGDVTEFSVSYRLQLPNPNRMRQGTYEGSVNYHIGPGRDIDLGNGVTNLNSDVLTIRFVLTVEHALDVRLAPGGDRAVLEPPGGWQAWMAGRGAPPNVERDLPMYIWSTGPLSLFKRCEYEMAGTCAIRNERGRQVPLQVAVSMPRDVTLAGRPVVREVLPTGKANALDFEQSVPLSDARGQLHFSVDSAGVSEMTRDAGTTYKGKVTVVFDAEL